MGGLIIRPRLEMERNARGEKKKRRYESKMNSSNQAQWDCKMKKQENKILLIIFNLRPKDGED